MLVYFIYTDLFNPNKRGFIICTFMYEDTEACEV